MHGCRRKITVAFVTTSFMFGQYAPAWIATRSFHRLMIRGRVQHYLHDPYGNRHVLNGPMFVLPCQCQTNHVTLLLSTSFSLCVCMSGSESSSHQPSPQCLRYLLRSCEHPLFFHRSKRDYRYLECEYAEDADTEEEMSRAYIRD